MNLVKALDYRRRRFESGYVKSAGVIFFINGCRKLVYNSNTRIVPSGVNLDYGIFSFWRHRWKWEPKSRVIYRMERMVDQLEGSTGTSSCRKRHSRDSHNGPCALHNRRSSWLMKYTTDVRQEVMNSKFRIQTGSIKNAWINDKYDSHLNQICYTVRNVD